MKTVVTALCLSFSLACASAVETPAAAAAAAGREPGVRLAASAADRSGVVLGQVRSREVAAETLLPGEVAWDEDRTVRVGSIVEGSLIECCLSVGTWVRKGQVLARIHSHETHEALARARSAAADLAARRADLDYARIAHQRASRLLELKAGSLQAEQQASTALQHADSAVVSAEANLKAAGAHLEYLGVDPKSAEAEAAHEAVEVRAPISGVIVRRRATTGGVVTPADELYSISDLGSVWVIARAPEQALASLRPGLAARVSARAYPDREFSGRVVYVSDELDPATKTVQIRCEVPNPGRALKIGMYAEASIAAGGSRSILTAPRDAVQSLDGAEVVFAALGDGRFEPRPVRVGAAFGEELEIVDGLREGESIVVGGAFVVKSEFLKGRFAEE